MSTSARRASLREGWREIALGDILAAIEGGRSPRSEDRPPKPGERAVLKVSAVRPGVFDPIESKVLPAETEMPARATVRDGDVLMTRANTADLVGSVCRVHGTFENLYLCDKTLRLVIDETEVDAEFVVHALAAPGVRQQLAAAATGTSGSMKNISQAKIRSIRLLLPPIPEQRRVANVLEAIDVAIAAVSERARVALGLKASYLSATMESLRAVEERGLGSLADVQSGISWKKTDELAPGDPNGIGVMGVSNVQRDNVHVRNCSWIRRTPQAEQRAILGHTILTIRTNGNAQRIGNVHLAPPESEGYTISSFLTAITPHDPEDARYILSVLQSPQVQRAITAATSGSTGLKNIAVTWVRELEIPWPEKERRREIETIAAGMDAVAMTDEREESELRALRAAVLSALMTGAHMIPASYDLLLDRGIGALVLEPVSV